MSRIIELLWRKKMSKEDEMLNELKKIRFLLEANPATITDAPQPSDEKTIKYDFQSSISFLGILTTICCLLGGFAFTGIIAFLAFDDASTLLSQVILFALFIVMGMFLGAVFTLNNINNLVSMQSQTPIIPIYPTEWRTINILMAVGSWGIQFVVPLMFLSKNLIVLFVLSMIVTTFWLIIGYLGSWKPIERELRRKGILR